MRPVRLPLVLALCSALAAPEAWAQAAQPTKHEFRGAWIATVFNLDWPRAATPAEQQAELLLMLDRLKEAGINAVFIQVRSACDALYDSPLEPWSFWLTGRQGAAPDPWYDPLAFAVREAHRRGMELHAWFNPYRAQASSAYEASADHVTRTHPEWILQFGQLRTLDPGRSAVRNYVTRVIVDVARRYDIDGVHFDDYFYPYPPNQISTEDAATFAEESRGFASLSEWRRDNVNIFIAQVADSLRALKPALKFGVSPFGIWKNGVPEGIHGLDSYDVIFADPTAWLAAGTVDYLVPQLYWPFGGPQDYDKLASWWAEQVRGRHLYTGHALYRADSETNAGTLFSPEEIPGQVRFNRGSPDIQGSVFFRARNLTHHSSQGFAELLKTDLYRHPALTPPMAWKVSEPPAAPGGLKLASIGDREVELAWHPVEGARRYAVYRVRSPTRPEPGCGGPRRAQPACRHRRDRACGQPRGVGAVPLFRAGRRRQFERERTERRGQLQRPGDGCRDGRGRPPLAPRHLSEPVQHHHSDRSHRGGDRSRGAAHLQPARAKGTDPGRGGAAQPRRARLRVGCRG